jgi:DNA polymerase elongation subunit (family B)
MRRIVFDIETCAYPVSSLSESQREFIFRYAEKERDEETRAEKLDEAERYLSLYPLTSKVIAIGMYDIESGRSVVYFEGEPEANWTIEEKSIKYIGCTEAEMLRTFWEIMEKTGQVITFNGRNFDVPFLMLRSAMLKVKPSKNFMANRYDKIHIDLLDQLTYYGLTKKFNLDFYCHAFGVESSKSKGVTGMEVKTLYEAGRIKEIAIYCGEDVRATYELFEIWNKFLNI